MKKNLSKYYILLVLSLMFAAPGLAAYIFYQHPSWLGASTVNKGTLLNPPIALKSFNEEHKWRIVFWNPEVCEQECLKQLNVLARVRLALGRKLYQVEQWLLVEDDLPTMSERIKLILKEQDFHIAQLSANEADKLKALIPGPKIFIANPDNYLILSYSTKLNPDDIYKDLKLLLNTSEHKSG